jgi:cephalosporin-C deacetylase-like acetyl esterase
MARLLRSVLVLACAAAAFAPLARASGIFDYDRAAPLDLREIRRETRGEALVRDVTFDGGGRPVKAYLVGPASATGSSAGILYVHWLGEPSTTNRSEFLNEALALAGHGVVSLLVDAMWAEPGWYEQRIPEEDYDRSVGQVIALRRALDALLAQPGVDPARLAYVGHDFGAMYGAVMGAVDQRPKTYVLMAGAPHFIDWSLFARKPQDPAAYRAQLAPLDPVAHVARLAPAPVFFQFAATDEYVSALAAAEFYAAAAPRKQAVTYRAGHDLHTAEVTTDRIAWLLRELNPR